MTERLKIFLCHSKEDKVEIRKLHNKLTTSGFNVWFDEVRLLPGQEWQLEIPKAVRDSHVVIICLSQNSVNKEGYIQKEIRVALDVADEKPEGTIYLIPARLQECSVPSRLSKWQWVDLFEDNGYKMLVDSLKLRMESLQINELPTDSEMKRFRQIDNNEITTDSLTIEQVLSLARTSISIYNNPRFVSDNREGKRECINRSMSHTLTGACRTA